MWSLLDKVYYCSCETQQALCLCCGTGKALSIETLWLKIKAIRIMEHGCPGDHLMLCPTLCEQRIDVCFRATVIMDLFLPLQNFAYSG